MAPVADALDRAARQLGATRPQVCVAWVLPACALSGAEPPEHVNDNLAGTRLKLPPGVPEMLDAASAELRGVGTSR